LKKEAGMDCGIFFPAESFGNIRYYGYSASWLAVPGWDLWRRKQRFTVLKQRGTDEITR
jgi:hypothetical protein